MNKYRIIAELVLLIAVIVLLAMIRGYRSENKRLSNNQTALLDTVERYRTKDGAYAVSVKALELSKREISEHCEELKKTCSDLKIKIRRLESYSNSTTETDVKIQTVWRDSFRFVNDTIIDTLKCAVWRDPWVSVDLCGDDTLSGSVSVNDTICTIIHKEPRRFLWFRFGCKSIKCDVVSKNPHSIITSSQTIIKKD